MDADSLRSALRDFAPTKVIHLAARVDCDGNRRGCYLNINIMVSILAMK